MLVPASGAWRCPQRALSAARTARSRRRRQARPSTPTIAKGSSTIKKVVPVDPRTSLSAETLLVAPLAMGFLAFSYTVDHHGQFSLTTAQFVLLASSGLLTAAPLLFFGAAAKRIPVVTMGCCSTSRRSCNWCGRCWFGTKRTVTTWVGFGMVWCALMLFYADAIRNKRKALRLRERKFAT